MQSLALCRRAWALSRRELCLSQRRCSRGLSLQKEALGRLQREAEALTFRRIAIAMSGGVDSSVAALLLKQAGFNVFGIHMRNWEEEEEKGAHAGPTHCSSAQDLLDTKRTCDALGIELHQVRTNPKRETPARYIPSISHSVLRPEQLLRPEPRHVLFLRPADLTLFYNDR